MPIAELWEQGVIVSASARLRHGRLLEAMHVHVLFWRESRPCQKASHESEKSPKPQQYVEERMPGGKYHDDGEAWREMPLPMDSSSQLSDDAFFRYGDGIAEHGRSLPRSANGAPARRVDRRLAL